MKGIFISYRRQDSQSAAGRLADHLRDEMPEVAIFRDVETIEPGIDFVDAIDRALVSCSILLAVIGPRWANITDGAGQRRLDNPADYTRLEIATALQRNDVRVIPVLVEGATMPDAKDLPDDLKALARRNAIELTDKRWEFDVSTLIDTLRRALGIEPSPRPSPPNPSPAKGSAWKKWAWGVGAAFVLAALFSAFDENPDVIPQPMPAPVPVPQYATAQPPAAALTVSGDWRDAQGGSYRIIHQGGQTIIQGNSVYGAVAGAGLVQGNQFSFSYTVNGAPYQAVLLLSPDGQYLQGQYRGVASGEAGQVILQRIR